jgi:PKD repeat protein
MCIPSHTQGSYIRFVVRFVLATFLVFTLLVLSPPLLALADGGGVPCTLITVEGNTLKALDACDGQWHSTSFTGTYNACWDGVVTVIDSGNVYAYVYDAIDHQWHQVLVSSSGFNFIRSHQGIIVIQIPFTLEVLAYAYDPTDHQWHSTSMAPSGFAVIMYCYDGTILMDRAYTREVLGYAYDLFDHSWHIIQMSPNGSVVTHLLDVGGVTIDRAYTREVYGYVYDFTDHQWHSKQMSFGVAPLVRWCDGGVVIVQRDVSSSNIYAYVYNANDHQWHETHIANNLCSSAPSPPTPLAAFTSTPTTGMGSLCVHFVDQSYGGSSNIQWDFGDGSSSSEKSPFHTYTNPGYYTVSLRISGPGGTDIETKVNYIHVIQTPPAVSSVSPNQGTQAQTLSVTITGTSFTGATNVSFGAGITVNSFTVDSDTQITASITIAGSATPGARDVSVTTPGGTATKASSFTVNRAPPTITSVDPSGGVQGQSLSVTINGTYLIEASEVSFGSGITVNGFTVDSATQITANITIGLSATPGARDVSVTTLGGTATKTGGFTVNQAPPAITTVSPNSGMQGQTLSVTITGTYFTGASVVSFGSGITVNNFSVDNSTQVSTNVSISASATLGPRDVSVTTPVGKGTLASGFTITGLPPYTPSNPSPANHATGVSINADLSWTGGDPDAGDTVTYDVYFGTSSTPPLVSNNQSATAYDPGTLAYNTTYYWQIVATDNHGASTAGPLWNFTTKPEAVAQIVGETREVNSAIMGNVTVTLYQDGEMLASTVSDGVGNYELAVPELEDYNVTASKDGFRNKTQTISVTEPTTYTLDFVGAYGLVPNASDTSYVLACIDLWKFGTPPYQLNMSAVLAVIHAWKFPI